jgi:hypothetical protein
MENVPFSLTLTTPSTVLLVYKEGFAAAHLLRFPCVAPCAVQTNSFQAFRKFHTWFYLTAYHWLNIGSLEHTR